MIVTVDSMLVNVASWQMLAMLDRHLLVSECVTNKVSSCGTVLKRVKISK